MGFKILLEDLTDALPGGLNPSLVAGEAVDEAFGVQAEGLGPPHGDLLPVDELLVREIPTSGLTA